MQFAASVNRQFQFVKRGQLPNPHAQRNAFRRCSLRQRSRLFTFTMLPLKR
jgi:hypothetical protein